MESSVSITPRALHPRHGIHAPVSSTPDRVPGSIRRTATIDAIRPDGLQGDLIQIGRARDLLTTSAGASVVCDEATVATRLDYLDHYRLTSISSTPERPVMQRLVGTAVSAGFRARVVELLPDEREAASLLHLLLDDLPGAALVSGYAIGAAGERPKRKSRVAPLQVVDLCAGFKAGGTIMNEIDEHGHAPVVTGPLAPPLSGEDELGWHRLDPLPGHGMRRWRRLDLVARNAPVFELEAHFRDSHVAPNGAETVVHEYTVRAELDSAEGTIRESGATAHALPWLECIEAEPSGSRLAGRALAGLRSDVRDTFTGISTCTHLNDTVRSLEDARALLPLLTAALSD